MKVVLLSRGGAAPAGWRPRWLPGGVPYDVGTRLRQPDLRSPGPPACQRPLLARLRIWRSEGCVPLRLLRFTGPRRCCSGPGSPRPVLSDVFGLPAPLLTWLRPRHPRWLRPFQPRRLTGVPTDPSRWSGSAFLPDPGLLAAPPSYVGPHRVPNPVHLLASSTRQIDQAVYV